MPPRGDLSGAVARGAAASGVRTVLIQVVTAAGSIVLAHLLTPGRFAVYAIVFGAAGLLRAMTLTPLMYAFINHSDPEDDEGSIRDLLGLGLLTAAVGGVLLLLVGLVIGGDGLWICAGCAAFLPLTVLRIPALARCERRLALGTVAIVESTEATALHGGALLTAVLGCVHSGPAIALTGSGVWALGLGILTAGGARPRVRMAAVRRWAVLTRPFLRSAGLIRARDGLSLPLLAFAAGSAASGLYGWAAGVCGIVVTLPVLMSHALYLGVAACRDRASTERALGIAIRLLALTGALGMAIVVAAGPSLLHTLYTVRWRGALPAIALLGLAGAVNCVMAPLLAVGYADGRVRETNRWQGMCVAVVLMLGVPAAALCPSGADAATVFAACYTAGSVVAFAAAVRSTARRYRIAPALSFAAVCLAGGVIGVLSTRLMPLQGGATPWVSLVQGGLLVADVYVMVIVAFAYQQAYATIRETLSAFRSGGAKAGDPVTAPAPAPAR